MHATPVSVCVRAFSLFVLPILLLYFGIVPLKYRFVVLTIFFLALVVIIVKERWTPRQLGLRTDNLKDVLLPYGLFTVLGVLVLLGVARTIGRHTVSRWWTYPHFLFLFLPISFSQEFAYRAFLMPQLLNVTSSVPVVCCVNAALFAFLHVIYPDLGIILPLAFAGGLGFAVMYHRYPNLFAISASHMVLNFVAVLHSFFSLLPV